MMCTLVQLCTRQIRSRFIDGAQIMGTPERLWIILAIFGVSFTVGQNISGNNIFNFPASVSTDPDISLQFQVPNSISEIAQLEDNDFACFGDFNATPSDLYIDSWGQTYVRGTCLYKNPIQLLEPPCRSLVSSFSTMFEVDLSHNTTPTSPEFDILHHLAFIITGDNVIEGEPGLNSTNNGHKWGHSFAVQLDFNKNSKAKYGVMTDERDEVHVGINVNNTINQTATVSFPPFITNLIGFPLISYYRSKYAMWEEYDGRTQILDVSTASSIWYKKRKSVFSTKVDLTQVVQESMFIGFSGSVELQLKSSNVTSEFRSSNSGAYYITRWTFNTNGPAPDFRRNSDGTVFDPWLEAITKKIARRNLIVRICVPAGVVFFFLAYVIYTLHRRISRLHALAKKYQIEELEQLARGPQSFKYKVLSAATKGFHSTHLLGTGGFGSVYKGKFPSLPGAQSPTYVAIKRISATSHQGAREFLAEVKIIGQVQHRNLVRLLGWCHERGELLLVYDYMPNGSLDQHLFKCYKEDSTSSATCGGEDVLSWARRLKIISGVATALAYLHEEWEQRVIHRDVKSSNVMLDINFNARLGDFGLARLSDHAQAPPSTAVLAGTHGYLAPELGHTLKATEKTDVYSFGVMVLEVATGRRPLLPLDERRIPDEVLLVDWVWGLYNHGNVLEVADCKLEGSFDRGEMVTLLKIGLLCCHPDPDERPTMQQVMNIWKGASVFPPLPRSKPVPVFLHLDTSKFFLGTSVESNDENILITPMKGYAESMADKLDYTEAPGLCSGPGRSIRSRPWNSTPLPM